MKDVLFVSGIALVAFAGWLLHPSLAYLVAGLACLLVSLVLTVKK